MIAIILFLKVSLGENFGMSLTERFWLNFLTQLRQMVAGTERARS